MPTDFFFFRLLTESFFTSSHIVRYDNITVASFSRRSRYVYRYLFFYFQELAIIWTHFVDVCFPTETTADPAVHQLNYTQYAEHGTRKVLITILIKIYVCLYNILLLLFFSLFACLMHLRRCPLARYSSTVYTFI